MLLSESVEIKWANKYKSYYEGKGYKYTGNNKIFSVLVKDLPINSNTKVEVLCDYCDKNISVKTYQAYNKQRQIIEKDCCDECKFDKTSERNVLIYGVTNINKLDCVKSKIGNKNRKYSTEDVLHEMNKRNYTLMNFDKYTNIKYELQYICSMHPNLGIQVTTLEKLFDNKNCCMDCIRESNKLRKMSKLEVDVEETFKNFNCEVLDSQITSKKHKVKFLCNFHKEYGNQEIVFENVKNDSNPCCLCRKNSGVRLNFEHIAESFKQKNKSLASNNYINSTSMLEYVCNKHIDCGIQICSYEQLHTNKETCKFCIEDISNMIKLYYQGKLFESMINKGLIPTEDARYTTIKQKIPYYCTGHPKILQSISPQKFYIGHGCELCNRPKGEDHYNWKGGVSELNRHLRSVLRPIIKSIMENFDFKCSLTGITGSLEVHHYYNFSNIVCDVLHEVQLPIKKRLSEYSKQELEAIEKVFIDKHTGEWGVPILSELHGLFHKKYGIKNNNINQFNDFKYEITTKYGIL